MHTDDVLADATAPYDPAAQAVHAAAPVARLLYVPATQLVHTAAVLADATLLYAPAAHAVQLGAPEGALL